MLQMNFHPFPVINTERLTLRQIMLNDVPEMFFLRSDELVMKYIDKDPEKSIAETEEHIKKITCMIEGNESIIWGIALKNHPEQLIGSICLWKFQKEHFRAEVGYVLHPAHWRKGIIKEAIRAVIDFGFYKVGLHSIEAHINPDNIASAAVLESSGFKREAYFKENYFFNNKFLDTAIYSILHSSVKVDPEPDS